MLPIFYDGFLPYFATAWKGMKFNRKIFFDKNGIVRESIRHRASGNHIFTMVHEKTILGSIIEIMCNQHKIWNEKNLQCQNL